MLKVPCESLSLLTTFLRLFNGIIVSLLPSITISIPLTISFIEPLNFCFLFSRLSFYCPSNFISSFQSFSGFSMIPINSFRSILQTSPSNLSTLCNSFAVYQHPFNREQSALFMRWTQSRQGTITQLLPVKRSSVILSLEMLSEIHVRLWLGFTDFQLGRESTHGL